MIANRVVVKLYVHQATWNFKSSTLVSTAAALWWIASAGVAVGIWD